MFKKLLIGTLAAVIVVAAGASVYTALAAPAAESVPALAVSAGSADSVAAADAAVQPADSVVPAADEAAGLLYMYEEEKLARDVYTALYALWGQATFQNIAASEQAHMDAVKGLLDARGIAAPSNAAGVFADPSLQALYDEMLARGSLSLADALKVGTTIEEVDILDLQSRLAQTTDADIQLVYSNLMNGSFNHLRNFVVALERQTGEVYQPQYLGADLYQSILSAANGSGQGQAGAGVSGNGGRGRGTGTTSADPTSTNGTRGKGYRGGR